MKNLKIRTKLLIGFLIPVILMIINVFMENAAMRKLKQAEDTEAYIESYLVFSGILIVVSVLIIVIYAYFVIRTIRVSVSQLSTAAKDIALGKVDIKLVKHNNDEFGGLVDEYTKVIENIKYQADIAEEVANGNLTVQVTPKSVDDLLGNSLKKLVEDNQHAMSNINDAAAQVTVGASQVADASQSLAQGSTEQASAIQQITASIDEIADKTRQNAEQANSATELVVQ